MTDSQTFFGLNVVRQGATGKFVRERDIKNLPFYEFWRDSSVGSTSIKHPVSGNLIYLHDWEAFCRQFIKTGQHRYNETKPAKRTQSRPQTSSPATATLNAIQSLIIETDEVLEKRAEQRRKMMLVLRTQKNVRTQEMVTHFQYLEEQLELANDAWSSAEDLYIDNALSVLINARFVHNQSKQR